MPRVPISSLRQRVLRRQGLTPVVPPGKRRSTLTKDITPTGPKTWAMLAVESRHNLPIEEILLAGTVRYVAKKYGIHFTTVAKWRKRLHLTMPTRNGP